MSSTEESLAVGDIEEGLKSLDKIDGVFETWRDTCIDIAVLKGTATTLDKDMENIENRIETLRARVKVSIKSLFFSPGVNDLIFKIRGSMTLFFRFGVNELIFLRFGGQ